MSELERLEKKMVSLFEENRKYMDGKFGAIDQRFESIEKKLESHDEEFKSIKMEFAAVRFEMESESKRIQNKIDKVDGRVHNLEIMAKERWNVPDLEIKADALGKVVTKHSEQISVINEKLGIATG